MFGQNRPAREGIVVLILVALIGVTGAAEAQAEKIQPTPVKDFSAPGAGEHPRLIVRKGVNLQAVRDQARTEWGQKVVERLDQALRLLDLLAIRGRNREVIKEAGFKAAGYASRYLLTGQAADAAQAAEICISQVVNYPMAGRLETADRASRLQGVALAYDMAHDGWSGAQRKQIRAFLRKEAETLIEKVGGLQADRKRQPDHICAIASAGMAEMAILGDDPDDRKGPGRIDAITRAVCEYIASNLGPDGFDANGESERQVALASGILPYAYALKHTRGKDLTGLDPVANALTPMVYQTVPGVGMALTGQRTAAYDRTGIFAMATPLTPQARKPGIAWLFQQVGGEKYLGVVRPHQGLFMLVSGMEKIEPAAPSDPEAWPTTFHSAKANMAGLRSRWKDREDILVMLYGPRLRILGGGGVFVNNPMQHAAIYSHDRGAGRIDSFFSFDTVDSKKTLYGLSQSGTLRGATGSDDGKTLSMTAEVQGRVSRRATSYQQTKRGNGTKTETVVEVPEGGDFTGRRVCGVDYSGKSGAEALVVLVDTLKGGGKASRCWVLHTGTGCSIRTDGNRFSIKGPNGTLHGLILQPAEVQIKATSNAPYANFLSITTEADTVQAVLVIGGKAPKLNPGADLAKGVKIGGRTIQLDGDRIRFGD